MTMLLNAKLAHAQSVLSESTYANSTIAQLLFPDSLTLETLSDEDIFRGVENWQSIASEDQLLTRKNNEVRRLKKLCNESIKNRAQCKLTVMETRTGAELGKAKQQDDLGNFYYFALIGDKPNPGEALKWYHHAAQQNSHQAQYKLYQLFNDKQLQDASIHKSRLDWLTESAEGGFASAQFKLGLHLYEGNLGKKNVKRGVHWMRKASASAHNKASRSLIFLYFESLNTLSNFKTADNAEKKKMHHEMSDATAVISYFVEQAELVAERGNADIKHDLAMLFHNAPWFYNDNRKAFRWMKLAAEANDRRAQLNLGIMYFNGLGIKPDFSQAFYWINKAAKQNYPIAQFFLATMYTDGQGVKKDSVRAAELLEQAADKGVIAAKLNLANLYATGQGVPQNISKANELREFALSKQSVASNEFDGLVVPR